MDECQPWEDVANILFRQLRSIPRELRDLIYEYALLEPDDIIVPNKQKPALFGVCQQVRHEATPIYYAINTFRAFIFDDGQTCLIPFQWIRALEDNEAKAVTKLAIEFGISDATKKQFEAHLARFKITVTPLANNNFADPAAMTRAVDTLEAGLQACFNVDVLNSINAEMRTVQRAGKFDLAKLSFEVEEGGKRYGQANRMFKTILDQCLGAVIAGKRVTISQ
ncbi:hypothetical protein LTR85_005832 [Meristemomyces frigidus]|nr:hypothetical protein LTR85_005832 [Meristemomyces frigidus]